MVAEQHAADNKSQKKLKKKKEIKICTEMNEKENITTKNLWDSVKAVLRGWQYRLTSRNKKKSQITQLYT